MGIPDALRGQQRLDLGTVGGLLHAPGLHAVVRNTAAGPSVVVLDVLEPRPEEEPAERLEQRARHFSTMASGGNNIELDAVMARHAELAGGIADVAERARAGILDGRFDHVRKVIAEHGAHSPQAQEYVQEILDFMRAGAPADAELAPMDAGASADSEAPAEAPAEPMDAGASADSEAPAEAPAEPMDARQDSDRRTGRRQPGLGTVKHLA
eukprot:COSAG04_NODE_3514_length_2749_cov_59.658708_1_plen_211_part_00